ncbi:glycosyltransferase family 4 protein [Marinobacterium weihaiense]|uniref:Glycosyltransferase family 4 protein n=1 Tax=Marinobacterium weihaiense TaxID=2851016 RepID=A0ABS6M7Q5_9GAMM|nr:glycosyltransferase family 1 protein [Marinobacterium weihaiense]MBV0932309.1 glycosyltransferase family 4 protein [Marinobacterium weihaiense]
MKVVVNISALTPPLTGIGRYTYHMLKGLLNHPGVSDIQGISPSGLHDRATIETRLQQLDSISSSAPSKGLRQLFAKVPGARLGWRLLGYIQALRYRRQLTGWVYWEPGFSLLPLQCPSVATLYDLSHMRHPDYHPGHRVKLLSRTIPHTLARASRILTISEFTRSELHALLSPKQPVDIAHPGIDSVFFDVTQADIERCRGRHCLPEQFILSLGTLEPRKNLTGLIQAFRDLPETLRSQYPLVIAGAKGWRDSSINSAIAELTEQGEALVLGYVDQHDIPALYAAASLTAYVSHYEGFGMPVAESMAAGTAVLTSNVTSMPEVAAGNAITANPGDTRDITAKLKMLLSTPELREQLAAAGRIRARDFTWVQATDTLAGSLGACKSHHR